MHPSICPHCGAEKHVRVRQSERGVSRYVYCKCQWREPVREWKRRNPEKVRAHRAVRKAVARGALQPQPCEVCGIEPAEGHHDDYAALLRAHEKTAGPGETSGEVAIQKGHSQGRE